MIKNHYTFIRCGPRGLSQNCCPNCRSRSGATSITAMSARAVIRAEPVLRRSVMVQLVKHDLEFILKQIKIAEENSAAHSGFTAKPLTDLVSHHLLPYGLRTVNGSYNNL